jgi:hypothetical protein
MNPILRVSILTIPDGHIEAAAEAMRKAEEELRGILKLKGLRAYFAGVDRARSQLTNVSVWDSPENAEQMSSFLCSISASASPLREPRSCDPSQTSTACGSGVTSAAQELLSADQASVELKVVTDPQRTPGSDPGRSQ